MSASDHTPTTRRLRLLEVTGVSVGGSAEHLMLLSKMLDPSRFDVHIALWSGGPLDSTLGSLGHPVHVLDKGSEPDADMSSATAFSGGKLRYATGFLELIRLMRRERIDLVHTHTTVAGLIGRLAAVIARVPLRVHMLHSISYRNHSAVMNQIWRVIERAMAPLTTHFIAGSDAIVALTADSGVAPPQRITRIHYSLDLDRRVDFRGTDIEAARRRLGAGDDDVLITLVGRLEQQKGVEVLLDAVSALKSEYPTIRVGVVGDGSLRPALEAQAARQAIMDRVTFAGWTTDISSVMAASDIVAVPSRWEAFGIVNLEAMAAGRPIVGSAVEGMPEVVIDGETGILVPPEDVDALAGGLRRLIDSPDLRTQMGEAGRDRLYRFFRPDQMVEAHQQLFEELAAADHRVS